MSIVRFFNDQNRTAQSLRRILSYCSRNNKVPEELIGGHGILKESIDSQMLGTKKLFHQETGKQYLHLIVSNDDFLKDVDTAHQIGNMVAEYFSEFQVAVYTHTDTNNLHSHLVVNTVNCISGKKLSMRKSDFYQFLLYVNQVFIGNGLNPISAKQILICNEDCSEDSWDYEYDDNWDYYDEDPDDLEREFSYLKGLCKTKEKNTGIKKALHFSDMEFEKCDMISYLQSR